MNDVLNLPDHRASPGLPPPDADGTGTGGARPSAGCTAPAGTAPAAVYPADEIPDDIVTLDTFVTYRMGGEDTPDKRMLIHPDDRMWPPAELSILTPVVLALLGLRAGYRMPVIGCDGSPEGCVEVESVGPRVTGAILPLGSTAPDATATRWT